MPVELNVRCDIFTSTAEAWVNPINCVGTMGRGLAFAFHKAYPRMYKDYRAAVKLGYIRPGKMWVWETGQRQPRLIVNFPTKMDWRERSRMEDIDSGLIDLILVVRVHQITSIAVPGLGSGLGGLYWRDVKPRIIEAFKPYPDIRLMLYSPTL